MLVVDGRVEVEVELLGDVAADDDDDGAVFELE